MYVIPENTGCGWASTAYLGCDGSFLCRTWVDGSVMMGSTRGATTNPAVAMHGLGSNLYLYNSASNISGTISQYGRCRGLNSG